MKRSGPFEVTAGLMLSLCASLASAAPDVAGSTIIDEPNGSVGLCDAPCHRIEKSFEVFLDGNPTSTSQARG